MGNGEKRESGLHDILFMVNKMAEDKISMPLELSETILTKGAMRRFWEVLPDVEHGFYKDILEELRIDTPLRVDERPPDQRTGAILKP